MSLPDASSPRASLEAGLLPAYHAYRAYVARVYREHFGVRDPVQADLVADDWFHCDARHDFRFEELQGRLGNAPEGRRAPRVLDLASGMGTAVLRGLHRGFDVYGLEPDAEKLGLMRARMEAGGFPADWTSRFARAVGEHLPYKDGAFDCVLSYQTLEHVQDADAVLAEMLRVTRAGGALHLRCPDYRGTFEGHYLLPWLPLLPRPLARVWLRLCGRPVAGFEGVRYTTRPSLVRGLNAAARRAGIAIEILDLEGERLQNRIREKALPGWRGPAWYWRAFTYARRLFREDVQINLWVELKA